MLYENVMNSN